MVEPSWFFFWGAHCDSKCDYVSSASIVLGFLFFGPYALSIWSTWGCVYLLSGSWLQFCEHYVFINIGICNDRNMKLLEMHVAPFTFNIPRRYIYGTVIFLLSSPDSSYLCFLCHMLTVVHTMIPNYPVAVSFKWTEWLMKSLTCDTSLKSNSLFDIMQR